MNVLTFYCCTECYCCTGRNTDTLAAPVRHILWGVFFARQLMLKSPSPFDLTELLCRGGGNSPEWFRACHLTGRGHVPAMEQQKFRVPLSDEVGTYAPPLSTCFYIFKKKWGSTKHPPTIRPRARSHPSPAALYTRKYLVAVERSPSTVGLLAAPRHHVHHPWRLVRRAKAGPLALEAVAGLPLAVRGRAPAASHVDHGGRLVEGAEPGLLSLCRLGRSAGKRACVRASARPRKAMQKI